MAAEHLSYSGINRSITDYAGSRACEELINLRPTSEGLIPVRPFTTKFSNKGYDRVFIHHAVGKDIYIGIYKTSSYVMAARLNDSTGASAQNLFSVTLTGSSADAKAAMAQRIINNLHFAAAGNIAMFSVCDRADSVYGNWAFTWKMDESLTPAAENYVVTEANVPKIDVKIQSGEDIVKKTQEVPEINRNSTETDVINAVENAVSAVQEINPDVCFGVFIMAVAFKTKDGETFWTDNWLLYSPLSAITTTSPPYEDDTTLNPNIASLYDDFFDEHGGHGFRITSEGNTGIGGNKIGRLEFYGTTVKVKVGALSNQSGDPNYWNKNTSNIQSVEVYTSRPIPYFDTESAFEGFRQYQPDPEVEQYGLTILLAESGYAKMDLGNQLLYHQASIQMESLLDGSQYAELHFGGNIQTTNKTLRVDAGATNRYGNLLSYNSRFHYYDSVSKTGFGKAAFGFGYSATNIISGTTYILARYSDNGNEKLMCLDQWSLLAYLDPADIVIAPSVNIHEIITYAKASGHYYWRKYRMTPSNTYNFSVCTEGSYDDDDGTGTVTEFENAINTSPVVYTVEQASINVTEQYNPFVFRVEHSYLAPGRITDLVPQNFVVTDATYGREPLDVFTERGIYALIQGSGDILYAWFDPIDPMVAYGRAVPTEMGIFFLSGGCLYLCAGHRVTLVSDALMAGPHKYVRSAGPNSSYAKIAGSSGIVDMSLNVSAVDFVTFVANGGRLSYNRFRQEVYVSNPNNQYYQYTYVLSLKYRQWFKVEGHYWQDEPASTIISRPGSTSGNIDVLNMETEATGSVKIHLQTRPFSMGYQYAHVHRALSMIRAKLSTGDKAVLHLYGSDDLQNWTLLAYASRSGSSSGLYISQLRTPTAARSWRYYTICLTGQVPSAGDFQTDVGPFVVDYSAVVRRLG